jgi:uncharacterized protein YndB with AHSA1/START domain
MPLEVEMKGETQLIVRRRFSAPPSLVFRAHVDAALIPRWMNVMPGWSMPEAESDPRAGGRFRFRWRDPDGGGFRIEGTYLEIDAPRRILHVERMFLPEPTLENRIETLFLEQGTGTRLVMTMTLPDAEARKALLATGATDGMEMTYDRLETVLSPQTPT